LRCHFILKMIILPRQARDKHREDSKKDAFLQDPRDRDTLGESGKKTRLCAPFYTKNDHFAKTGSGQT
jgi:hypothetical protein